MKAENSGLQGLTSASKMHRSMSGDTRPNGLTDKERAVVFCPLLM
jgi:hypothetical protein